MDEKFACPHCHQNIVIENAPLAGVIQCPNCRQAFNLPGAPGLKRSLASPWVWCLGAAIAGTLAAVAWITLHKPAVLTISRSGGPGISPPSAVASTLTYDNKSLNEWLGEMEGNRSRSAQNAFKKWGRAVVPDLIRVVQDQHAGHQLQSSAAQALSYAGNKDGPEVQVLFEALKREHNSVSASCVSALHRLGIDHQILIPLFIEKLDDPDKGTRRSAAINLGRIGPAASDAVPGLLILTKDHDKNTRDSAVEALIQISPPKLAIQDQAVAGALADLNNPTAERQLLAQKILREQGSQAVPELIRIVSDENLEVLQRRLAAEALGFAGKKDGPEVQALIAATKDRETGVRNQAITALGRLDVDPPTLIPACIEMLSDANSGTRRRAAEDLGRMGALAKEALPALKHRAISEKTGATRKAIADAIKRIES